MAGSVFVIKSVVPGGHSVDPEHEGEEEVEGDVAEEDTRDREQGQPNTQVPSVQYSTVQYRTQGIFIEGKKTFVS